jgi:hypothetical protein
MSETACAYCVPCPTCGREQDTACASRKAGEIRAEAHPERIAAAERHFSSRQVVYTGPGFQPTLL